MILQSIKNNYRPISFMSFVGKVMERCVHKHLYNYIVPHQILTPLESGFVQCDSTTYQLLLTIHTFCVAAKKYVLSFATLARPLTESGIKDY